MVRTYERVLTYAAEPTGLHLFSFLLLTPASDLVVAVASDSVAVKAASDVLALKVVVFLASAAAAA